MSIYKKWLDLVEQDFTQEEHDKIWKEYLTKEQSNYETIINTKETSIKGNISELANSYDMDTITFAGFLDGINTSFEEELNLEELSDDSEINSNIVWDKLYFNMLNAKADWLYELDGWDDILSVDERKSITKKFNKSKIVVNTKQPGRNEPCPCGSGKKYKKCCINK